MAAITWRNVNGPSLAEASRPLEAANAAISSGFQSLGNVLNKQEATETANWNQVKENNTQNFLNRLYEAQGAEGYKALQDSGELNRMLAANGAQIDRAVARNAMDTRLSTLQDRDVKGITYKNTMLDDAQEADVRRIATLSVTNPDAAAAELALKPELRKAYELAKGIDQQQQTLVTRGREEKRFGWESEKAPLEIQGTRLSNSGKATANELAGLQVKEAKLKVADAEEGRRLTNELAVFQQRHLAESDAAGKTMGALAAELKLPVSAAGYPKFSEMTKEQVALFDTTAKARNMPLSEAYTSGDTNAAQKFLASLQASNRFRPETLAKNRDTILAAADSTTGGGLVGNDAFSKKLGDARKEVYFDEKDANNWYAPGSDNARRAYDATAKEIEKMFGENEKEDLPAVQKLLYDLSVNGIEVKGSDGKIKKVVPSKNDILAAVRSTKEGLIWNSGRASDIKSFLKKAAKNSNSIQMMEDGSESEEYRRDQAVKALLNKK